MMNKSENNEVEITPQMIEAGEDVLSGELGGAVSSHWDPRDLAIQVYRAMIQARLAHEGRLKRDPSGKRRWRGR